MELPTDFLSLGRGSVKIMLSPTLDFVSQIGMVEAIIHLYFSSSRRWHYQNLSHGRIGIKGGSGLDVKSSNLII